MILELIGFVALLALGIYLLVTAVAAGIGESAFCGGIGIVTAMFFACACAVLGAAFYLAPFTISWGLK